MVWYIYTTSSHPGKAEYIYNLHLHRWGYYPVNFPKFKIYTFRNPDEHTNGILISSRLNSMTTAYEVIPNKIYQIKSWNEHTTFTDKITIIKKI